MNLSTEWARPVAQTEVPLILWTPIRHNQPKEVSDGYAATEVHIRI